MVSIWVVFLLGTLLLNITIIPLTIVSLLLDVVLILKVYGQDIKIR